MIKDNINKPFSTRNEPEEQDKEQEQEQEQTSPEDIQAIETNSLNSLDNLTGTGIKEEQEHPDTNRCRAEPKSYRQPGMKRTETQRQEELNVSAHNSAQN